MTRGRTTGTSWLPPPRPRPRGNEPARFLPGAILINDGSAEEFTLTRFGDGQGAVYGVAIGDVNGDGAADIVAARSGAPNTLYLGRR